MSLFVLLDLSVAFNTINKYILLVWVARLGLKGMSLGLPGQQISDCLLGGMPVQHPGFDIWVPFCLLPSETAERDCLRVWSWVSSI